LRATEAVGPLLDLVRKQTDPYTQAAAVEALGWIGGAGVRATLADLAEHGPVLARRKAAEALGRLGPEGSSSGSAGDAQAPGLG
jgi:HEAT repeat protein